MSAYSSKRLHPASLLPFSAHNPNLLRLVRKEVSWEMIHYVALHTRRLTEGDVLDEPESTPSPPPRATRPESYANVSDAVSLPHFIAHIVHQSNVQVGTLLATTIYMERLRAKFPTPFKGGPCSVHRIFLATLIVTAKYLNDSSPKNIHWSRHAAAFSVEEINAMEREILGLLDFDLRFDEPEACTFFAPFMSTVAAEVKTRANAIDKVSKASRARVEALQTRATPSPELAETPGPSSQSSSSASSTSVLATTIKDITKKISRAHLPVVCPEPIPMRSDFSARSSCSTSSSEMGSMVEDTGSSSGSSSGWITSDSESDSEDHGLRIYSANQQHDDSAQEGPLTATVTKKPFLLRPAPPYAHRNLQQDRSRKPSDSSVCTITALSPQLSLSMTSLSLNPRRTSAKRTHTGTSRDEGMQSSRTMPSLPRSGTSVGFLSRMWGVAKGQALGQQPTKMPTMQSSPDLLDEPAQQTSAFRRLMLSHGRPTRGATLDV